MGGKLEVKWIGSYAVVEVKENDGYIIKEKYSKVMEKMILIDQVKSHFDETLRRGNKRKMTM